MKTFVNALQGLTTFSTLAAVLWLAPLAAHAQFNYETNNGEIWITKYTGSGGAVTIPDTITGLAVTVIGEYAFQACKNVTTVTISQSVRVIELCAFYGCSVTDISIPGSVTNIGTDAFYSCVALNTLRACFENALI
jgi:hypothetical protein